MNSKGFSGFALVCALLIGFNTFSFWQKYFQERQHPFIPLHSLGYKFLGLDNIFKNVRYAGYYTDKDIEAPLTIAQFEQAQYTLAPTVLVLNKTDYPFVFFDCSSPAIALKKIQEFGLRPLSLNTDIILAVNPSFKP